MKRHQKPRPLLGADQVAARIAWWRCAGPYLSGKTSLLESILYATGAIGRRGSTRARHLDRRRRSRGAQARP